MSLSVVSQGAARTHGVVNLALLAMAALALAACSPQQQPAGPPPKAQTAQVDVWPVQTQSLSMEQTLAGRTAAQMVSEVRPQIGGIIQKRLFTEGQQVKAGEVLYQIDPASYQAALANAKAALAQAEAAVLSAKPKAERYERLAKLDAVSQQDLDEARASLRQNLAAVQAAQAQVQTAQINLDYTRIKAPIAGRIGTSSVTPGALVTANQDTALATIRQLDPLYVDVTQSSAQLLALQRQMRAGSLKAVEGQIPVQLQLEDGSHYDHVGTLEVVGDAVDPSTGNVSLRAVVPNPEGSLLPGMYVKAQLPMAVNQQAILVPQTVVVRNTKGEATVLVVGSDGKVEQRVIEVGSALGSQWVVNSGLQAGEQLVVAGGSTVRAGDTVVATQVPEASPVNPASPATAASQQARSASPASAL